MIGTRVRVCEHHRIAERRGRVGEVIGYYGGGGGDDYVALEVRLSSSGECAGCSGRGTSRSSLRRPQEV